MTHKSYESAEWYDAFKKANAEIEELAKNAKSLEKLGLRQTAIDLVKDYVQNLKNVPEGLYRHELIFAIITNSCIVEYAQDEQDEETQLIFKNRI